MKSITTVLRNSIRTTWRLGAMIFILALSLSTSVQAQSGIQGSATSVTVRFSIPAIAEIKDVQHPSIISIDSHHVAQGYVDIELGTQLLLTTNADGCLIHATFDSTWIRAVETRTDGRVYTIPNGKPGPMLATKRAANTPMNFAYRLYLKPGVTEGARAWPVFLKLVAVPPEQFQRISSNKEVVAFNGGI